MDILTAADEDFVHFTRPPGPRLPRAYRHWRESYFFVAHPDRADGDVLLVTLGHHPYRGVVDAYVMVRVDGRLRFDRFSRPAGGDRPDPVAGPVAVTVEEPYRRVGVRASGPGVPVPLELTFTARTAPHALPRGVLDGPGGPVWDQRHMFQSGWFDGAYWVDGERRPVRRWWGQRDHSWGVRDHRNVPAWMWFAVQLPDGMLGLWCWEYPDGSRVFTEGCWAPAGDAPPVPLTSFTHELDWTGADGSPVGYGRDGEAVTGLAGTVTAAFADGSTIRLTGAGAWSARYGRLGGGQQLMAVRTDDGRTGTAIYEITGARHHRFFPVARATGVPQR
ncbi:hypothetical protein ABZX66_25570 [Micromonospora aurantiaca]|uniref:hypothetical protein n=1 Tax=Micromonospora aurantiaca (nom. illeg.) TaxID=47850 RepID=UPI0033BE249B